MGNKNKVGNGALPITSIFTLPTNSSVNLPCSSKDIKNTLFNELNTELTPELFETKNSLSLFYKIWTYTISTKVLEEDLLSSGEANSKQMAVTKCLFEYLERLSLVVIRESSLSLKPIGRNKLIPNNDVKSSNGFAAHINLEQASLSAIMELLERDTFLFYWFSKSEPIAISNIYSKDFLAFDQYYQKHGIKMSLYEMPLYEPLVTFTIVYEIQEADIRLFSFSSHFNKVDALKKALFEGFRYMQRIIERENYIDEHFVEKLEVNPPIEHHYYYYMHSKRKKAFDFIVNTNKQKSFSDIKSIKTINYKDYLNFLKQNYNIDISLHLAPVLKALEGKYVCIKAHSYNLQDMFWGNGEVGINQERFRNTKIILDYPHPIA